MSGCAVIAFLEAICKGFPIVLCAGCGGWPGMIVCPGVGGWEEGVFVSYCGSCGRGGTGIKIVAELSGEWDIGRGRRVEVDEDETLGGNMGVNFEERVL